MKKLTIGILAHVDSGKTTLSEAMLYTAGEIRRLGRVDHGDSFLDGNPLERNRGITIFSKQAMLEWEDTAVTLLDTPGHVDFSAEMERTLSVLDCAILVISASDGVQSHTETLWKLLERYDIPTFVFVNKMDLAIRKKEEIAEHLREKLAPGCVDFSLKGEALEDGLSLASESLTEALLETGTLTEDAVRRAILSREVFPCYFGSALKNEGVEEFLNGLAGFTTEAEYGTEFAARVFKIARDDNGERLTFLKVTGGSLHVKETIGEEKVDQIRIYSGARYQNRDEAEAGTVCAVTGLAGTMPGQGLGAESGGREEILEPFLTYGVVLPEGVDEHRALKDFRELSEEDPKLHVKWEPAASQITIQMMGQVQLEILTSMVEERFGYHVTFDEGRIVYKETMAEGADPVEGVGHFEPLRHYAEVHLILEPSDRGSGMTFTTTCDEDELDRNWQRLILTHLMEKEHRGTLTGAPITDMKITLAAGKAHKKHTEGGDFRQATYRAVRNGLMKADMVLLEPWFSYTIELPTENLGRAMNDIQRMHGTFEDPLTEGEMTTLTGRAPASEIRDYGRELAGYTKGRGRISCMLAGYDLCHNGDEVTERMGYDPLRDVENTPDSVFCSHGSGDVIPWDQVEEYMHLPSVLKEKVDLSDQKSVERRAREYGRSLASDKELMAIFERTYGPVKRHDLTAPGRARRAPAKEDYFRPTPKATQKKSKADPNRKDFILVDGYNLIYAWEELNDLAKTDFGAARDRLIDILCNYRGFTRAELIVVFDAYKVKGGVGSEEKIRNINVVYTKEAETADMYIERVTHEIARKHNVRVITSDGAEQLIILGHGALRTSSREFIGEIRQVEDAIWDVLQQEY